MSAQICERLTAITLADPDQCRNPTAQREEVSGCAWSLKCAFFPEGQSTLDAHAEKDG